MRGDINLDALRKPFPRCILKRNGVNLYDFFWGKSVHEINMS